MPETTPRAADRDDRYRRLAAVDLHGFGLDGTLDRVLAAVVDLLPTDAASVVLWDPLDGRVRGGAGTLDDAEGLRAGIREQGATRWVIDHGEQVAVADIGGDPFGPSVFAIRRDVAAYVATPLDLEGRTLGVVYALSLAPRRWDTDDLRFLRVVAGRAAAAVDAALLAEETRRQREQAEVVSFLANALIGVWSLDEALRTVAAAVSAGVAADGVRIRVDDAPGGGPKVITGPDPDSDGDWDGPADAAVAAAGDTVCAVTLNAAELQAHGAPDAGPAVVAPLRYLRRTIGHIVALRRRGAEDFDPDAAALLTAVANQAVVAVDNARLAAETQEALAELSAVYEIVQAQDTDLGMDAMLLNIAEVVASALPAHLVLLGVLESGRVIRHAGGGRGGAAVGDEEARDRLEGAAAAIAAAAEARSLTWVDDETPRLVVPLRNRSELVGVLAAERRRGHRPFGERDEEMARVMGAQVATAVANALLFEETQRLALTDPLCGIANRRYLFTLAERVFSGAKRYGRPMAVVMLDLDRFKAINDTYGHAVGDEVLVEVARRIRASIRDADVFGRYGGEEFALALPETDLSAAVVVAERVRAAIGGTPVETSAGPLRVTVSAGVAALDADVGEVRDLFERADAALLLAKRLGRDQVRAG